MPEGALSGVFGLERPVLLLRPLVVIRPNRCPEFTPNALRVPFAHAATTTSGTDVPRATSSASSTKGAPNKGAPPLAPRRAAITTTPVMPLLPPMPKTLSSSAVPRQRLSSSTLYTRARALW
jgi:hypothetical protein